MNPMETDLSAHLTTGAVVVYAIEYMKSSKLFPWLTVESTTACRVISAVAAAAMAFGIQASGDSAAGWTITIPPLEILLAGIWHWSEQFVVQQLAYDAVIQRSGKGVTT